MTSDITATLKKLDTEQDNIVIDPQTLAFLHVSKLIILLDEKQIAVLMEYSAKGKKAKEEKIKLEKEIEKTRGEIAAFHKTQSVMSVIIDLMCWLPRNIGQNKEIKEKINELNHRLYEVQIQIDNGQDAEDILKLLRPVGHGMFAGLLPKGKQLITQ